MNIPIIMLHHINNLPGPGLENWSISEEKFILLLNTIEKHGFTTTTFKLLQAHNYQRRAKAIILSFDDCPGALFEFAIPELLKRNMKAVFSIPTAQIGGFNQWDVAEQGFASVTLMNAEQLQYLSSLGMEIASHGQQHLRANKISEQQFVEEITASKKTLEKLLNQKIQTLAYPYGEVPKNYKKLVSQAGYTFGLSIYQWRSNQFALRRIGIHASDTESSLSFKLSRSYQFMRTFFDPILWIKKAIRV
ncbi:peptidoglycan/xylan/chitin deacetylase (PgdA/CDA1 family) [Pedobacter sp. W3I1]|uniref:polysaccharide deacetylase family protein n=1 Tax=Pedobacter sp. W3I1 TaxID=3042291 RepID=UPI00278147B5|nr:polysaccharide deacetylase family protein [Pedobacter sp. W3I1]MDQ0640925.1 peptidoglycan/xylan/chitin deacetylase (PgdA/CDA1 family) [Pedobacter sp. W3I1]